MPRILCKDMTEPQRYSVSKYMNRWFGENFCINDDSVVVHHASKQSYQRMVRHGYVHETFKFFDEFGLHVLVEHKIKKG